MPATEAQRRASKKWNETNADVLKEIKRRWNEANADRIREQSAKRAQKYYYRDVEFKAFLNILL
jgi:hypothetical protein